MHKIIATHVCLHANVFEAQVNLSALHHIWRSASGQHEDTLPPRVFDPPPNFFSNTTGVQGRSLLFVLAMGWYNSGTELLTDSFQKISPFLTRVGPHGRFHLVACLLACLPACLLACVLLQSRVVLKWHQGGVDFQEVADSFDPIPRGGMWQDALLWHWKVLSHLASRISGIELEEMQGGVGNNMCVQLSALIPHAETLTAGKHVGYTLLGHFSGHRPVNLAMFSLNCSIWYRSLGSYASECMSALAWRNPGKGAGRGNPNLNFLRRMYTYLAFWLLRLA